MNILEPIIDYKTTGVACKNLNRNFILIEKEIEYVEICKKKVMQSIVNFIKPITLKPSLYKNKRDELLKTHLPLFNDLRVKAGFKPLELNDLARRLQANPFTRGEEKDGEVEYLLKDGKENNNYWRLSMAISNKKCTVK